MIFGWIVIFNVDLSFIYYWGNVEHVTGTITDSFETNVSVNEETVFVNSYRFTASDGSPFEDFSYASGRWYRDGAKVTIEYPAGKPLSLVYGACNVRSSGRSASCLDSDLPQDWFLLVLEYVKF